MKVLVLEDEALVGVDLCDLLESAGGTVIGPFTNEGEVFDVLRTACPDAAIIDVRLRNRHCEDLARELRRRSIPFAIHTGVPRALDAFGAFDGAPRLVKPASRDDLLAIVQRLVAEVPRDASGSTFSRARAPLASAGLTMRSE